MAGSIYARNKRVVRKIINASKASLISTEQKKLNKKIVLAGGCFDILHQGHVHFLKKAKEQGDLLFLLLESDENVKKTKGEGRPINSQENRASVLSTLDSVNYILPLEGMTKDEDYDKLIVQIRPDIIAMTASDPAIEYRKGQCKLVGAKLALVTKRIENHSTTDLIKNINYYGKTH